jgi:hypothetical protein
MIISLGEEIRPSSRLRGRRAVSSATPFYQ